jgi:hypothetical protein
VQVVVVLEEGCEGGFEGVGASAGFALPVAGGDALMLLRINEDSEVCQ